MANEKKTIDASGTVENVEEGKTSRGDTYYKFTIDGQQYTLFDDDNRELQKGDAVVFNFYETAKGTKIYRNLNAIRRQGTNEEQIPAAPKAPSPDSQSTMGDYQAKDADKFELGMSKNNAILLMSKKLEKLDSAAQIDEYLKGAGPEFKKITEELFKVGKEIRKDILGY